MNPLTAREYDGRSRRPILPWPILFRTLCATRAGGAAASAWPRPQPALREHCQRSADRPLSVGARRNLAAGRHAASGRDGNLWLRDWRTLLFSHRSDLADEAAPPGRRAAKGGRRVALHSNWLLARFDRLGHTRCLACCRPHDRIHSTKKIFIKREWPDGRCST